MILALIPDKIKAAIFWSSVGWVDAVLVIAVLLGIFFGLKKGLAKMLQGLIEIMTAEVLVVEYSGVFAAFLAERFQIPVQILHVVMFMLIAIVSILIVRFMFQLLSLIVDVSFKQPLNNIGGGLIGGLRFVLFVGLISEFLMLFYIPFIQESFQQKSISGPYLIQICEHVHYFFEQWIPASLQA